MALSHVDHRNEAIVVKRVAEDAVAQNLTGSDRYPTIGVNYGSFDEVPALCIVLRDLVDCSDRLDITFGGPSNLYSWCQLF